MPTDVRSYGTAPPLESDVVRAVCVTAGALRGFVSVDAQEAPKRTDERQLRVYNGSVTGLSGDVLLLAAMAVETNWKLPLPRTPMA